MATELVPVTEGRADSTVQTVASGEYATILPRFTGRAGKVVVYLVNADGGWWKIKTISSRDTDYRCYQVRGPADFVVSVRNAGADLET